jgi:hypothetical protein
MFTPPRYEVIRMSQLTEENTEDKSRVRWSCPLCPHVWNFPAESSDDIGFFAVYHLISKHKLNPNEILAIEPSLEKALTEYCRGDY